MHFQKFRYSKFKHSPGHHVPEPPTSRTLTSSCSNPHPPPPPPPPPSLYPHVHTHSTTRSAVRSERQPPTEWSHFEGQPAPRHTNRWNNCRAQSGTCPKSCAKSFLPFAFKMARIKRWWWWRCMVPSRPTYEVAWRNSVKNSVFHLVKDNTIMSRRQAGLRDRGNEFAAVFELNLPRPRAREKSWFVA